MLLCAELALFVILTPKQRLWLSRSFVLHIGGRHAEIKSVDATSELYSIARQCIVLAHM